MEASGAAGDAPAVLAGLLDSEEPWLLDGLDSVEDLAQLSLSRHHSGAGFSVELAAADDEAASGEPEELAPTGEPDEAPCPSEREAICQRLRETPLLEHGHPLFVHGRAYEGPADPPRKTWDCPKPPRDDHDSPEWLTASEFEDQPEVIAAKTRQLAALIKASKRTVVYTGAGISAAVVGQAARSGKHTVGFKACPHAAKPTFTHYCLSFLAREGLIHSWVQQNHDGLPQKAGFPQECINEVHGSWYDPSNPVVKYGGNCAPRFERWMEEDSETADLVIVLGTSLGGLYADKVATKTASRSQWISTPESGSPEPGARVEAIPPGRTLPMEGNVIADDDGALTVQFDRLPDPVVLPRGHEVALLKSGGLGAVCINLQQTPRDGCFTLRLFDTTDKILRALLEEFNFSPVKPQPPTWPPVSRVLVPYDADGRRLPEGSADRWMWLDLRDGQKVRIFPGHNIQAARQPQYLHIGASKPVKHKGVTRKPADGLGTVVRRDKDTCCFVLSMDGVEMKLGLWWLVAARDGTVPVIPIINQKPSFDVPPM